MVTVTRRRRSIAKVRSSILIAASASLLLAACGSTPLLSDERRVEHSEDAANVFVSAYPAIPWTAIASKLEPKHNLTMADARALAAVTTQAQVSQFLSTFSASLGLSLPLRTNSSLTTIDAAGTLATTGTRTVAAPTVPATATQTTGITDASLVADLTKGPFAFGLDGATQLHAATGIYQLAQILDNQISSSLAPHGYEAHLITFQVNLQPSGRNLPYDAYVNLSLFPAPWTKAIHTTTSNAGSADSLPPVIVYPLVITDAMESANVGKSIEVVRQAALQLSGIVSNVGLGGSLAGGTDRLDALLGSDRNSLVTVGRVSDHTLRIRLGAAQQGSRKLALVPSTHNISVVVFTKSDEAKADLHIDKLAIVTQTELVDVDSGKALESLRSGKAARDELRNRVLRIVNGYDYGFLKECAGTEDYAALDLLTALDRGDLAEVSSCLIDVDPSGEEHDVLVAANEVKKVKGVRVAPALVGNSPTAAQKSLYALTPQAAASSLSQTATTRRAMASTLAAQEGRLRRLLASLMGVQTNTRHARLMVELSTHKNSKPMLPPEAQYAVLQDDTKSAASVVLRGGSNLRQQVIAARIPTNIKGTTGQDLAVLTTQVAVDAAGENVQLTFPSLIATQVVSTPVTGTPTTVTLEVTLTPVRSVPATSSTTAKYTLRVLPPRDEDDKDKKSKGPTSPVKATTSILVAAPDGTGRLTLLVGAWDPAKDGALSLGLHGAMLATAQDAAKLDVATGNIPVGPKTAVNLALSSLSPRSPVKIQTFVKDKPLGDALTFTVERGDPAPVGR